MPNTIIISPSGNLYGSEYVLLDFLKTTQFKYTVYVKSKGLFYKKLKKSTNHIINSFESVPLLYIQLFIKLLLNNNLTKIYVNEGGHIRYIKILAKLFRKRKFIIHLRIIEDCSKERLGILPSNIHLITISEYISSFLNNKYRYNLIYDPYSLTSSLVKEKDSKPDEYNIAIIGRVTKTKGLDNIIPLLNSLNTLKNTPKIIFNFYGDFSESDEWFIKLKSSIISFSKYTFNFHGFISNKKVIYSNTDLVIHLNTLEALGRIVFEAIDFKIPIITFNLGGVGELMNRLELNEYIINKKEGWEDRFSKKIIDTLVYSETQQIDKARIIIRKEFSPPIYTKDLEKIII